MSQEPTAKLQIDIPETHFQILKTTYRRKGQMSQVIRLLIQRHIIRMNLLPPQLSIPKEAEDVLNELIPDHSQGEQEFG